MNSDKFIVKMMVLLRVYSLLCSIELCMDQFLLLPSPPGNPRDNAETLIPGVGNC
jgi:hypothetical protein